MKKETQSLENNLFIKIYNLQKLWVFQDQESKKTERNEWNKMSWQLEYWPQGRTEMSWAKEGTEGKPNEGKLQNQASKTWTEGVALRLQSDWLRLENI